MRPPPPKPSAPKNIPLEKLREQNPVKFDPDRFYESVHDLLVAHNAEFAVIWLRDGDNIITRGWANSPEATLVLQVMERWLERHMDEIRADIVEIIQPKTKGMEDSLEAEFST